MLINLVADSDVITTELWAILGHAGRAAVVNTATDPTQAEVAGQALSLLANLAAKSKVVKVEIWATLGDAGRAAVVAAATTAAQTEVAWQALGLLRNLTTNSDVIGTELWTTLGTAGCERLIITATTAGEPEVASMAIQLLRRLQKIPHIHTAIWPLLQPRLAQLWVVTQRQDNQQAGSRFLFQQIRGNAPRTRQALNALNADIPATAMRYTIASLREWGAQVSRHHLERTALLTGIVQTNSTPQKMAVLMAVVMSGINIRQRLPEWREALRNQLLDIPLTEGIDPTPYRQLIGLGFDAACGNTSAVLGNQDLFETEKLQLLEIIYLSPAFLSAQITQENLSRVLSTPNISRNLKLGAIGLILHHGQPSHFQFKSILTWLKGEFKTDKHTVFTNLDTSAHIDFEEILALTAQRDQYLALYQNFRPHMTRDFIQAEIKLIEHRVLGKEMPEDFGAILIHQLQQFLSTTVIDAAVEDDGQYDSKSESK
ncbi:hypothetical protein [Polaromonas vacuolata]|uniref:hypothetical protein n=1 Tax=Polaromonas vacuolata TaxID=37448 RepID=UPI0014573F0F|nr:hypothetical protein [Polaromonas vacuolata]